jgi:hypothetical protein
VVGLELGGVPRWWSRGSRAAEVEDGGESVGADEAGGVDIGTRGRE